MKKEIERLSQSFGIGWIVLNSNQYKSEIRHYASYRELDFVTMDKLCINNKAFNEFISGIHMVVNANKDYYQSTLNDFIKNNQDKVFLNGDEIDEHIKLKHIPVDENEEIEIY